MSDHDRRCRPRRVVAGNSLSRLGLPVILVERYKFPRAKLCGEFISPECLKHFDELGVFDDMLAAGGDRVFETIFYETAGRSISVPSRWLDDGGFALSLEPRAVWMRSCLTATKVRRYGSGRNLSHRFADEQWIGARRKDPR